MPRLMIFQFPMPQDYVRKQHIFTTKLPLNLNDV